MISEIQLIDQVKANFYMPQALQKIREYYGLNEEELDRKAGFKNGTVAAAENQLLLLTLEDIFQIEIVLELADSVIYALADFFVTYPDGIVPTDIDMSMAVKNARKQIRLSGKRLESLAGLSINTVKRIESGERIATVLDIVKIARALNIKPSNLIGLANSYLIVCNEEDNDIKSLAECNIKLKLLSVKFLNMGRIF